MSKNMLYFTAQLNQSGKKSFKKLQPVFYLAHPVSKPLICQIMIFDLPFDARLLLGKQLKEVKGRLNGATPFIEMNQSPRRLQQHYKLKG